MKITSIRIYYPTGSGVSGFDEDYINLPLRAPIVNDGYCPSDDKDIFYCAGITGLEVPPFSATINNRTIENNFGVTQPRVIDILVKTRYHCTPSYARDLIYKQIAGRGTGSLSVRLYNEDVEVCRTEAFVSNVETDLNAVDPEILVSLTSKQPTFQTIEKEYLAFSGGGGSSGTIGTLDDFEDSTSTAPHGLYLEFEFTEDHSGIVGTSIILPDGSVSEFEINHQFYNTNRLIINSNYGELKAAVRKLTGPYTGGGGSSTVYGPYVETSVVNRIVPGSKWPAVYPGQNAINLINPQVLELKDLYYYPTYWGV